MKIKEIYNLAVKEGIEADFRGKEKISWLLDRKRKKFEKMSEEQKEEFDQEKLNNPFTDTRILAGDEEKEVKKIMVGIDIDGEELLLAKELGDIDLVISHHPRGKALAGLDDVMELQADLLHDYGVPINIAEKLSKKRIQEVSRGLAPGNHNRVVDTANLLGIPLMCIHTPADNLVAKFVEEEIKKNNPFLVEDVMKALKGIEEYRRAIAIGIGPRLFAGKEEDRVGKIALTEITGGTEGSSHIYEHLARQGIGTVVGMHISEKSREEAEKAHINVVIAGHISSDSIGMNLFLDLLEKEGLNIVPSSGLIRVSRQK